MTMHLVKPVTTPHVAYLKPTAPEAPAPAPVKLPARVLKALLACAGDDFTRPSLYQLHFEPTGEVVATDGHMIAIVETTARFDGPAFDVDRGAFDKLPLSGAGEVTITPTTIVVGELTRAVPPPRASAAFQPWRELLRTVMHTTRDDPGIAVNAVYMARACALAVAAAGTGRTALDPFVRWMQTGGSLDPMRFDVLRHHADSVTGIYGLIMPVRA